MYGFFLYRQPRVYNVHYQGIPVPLSNHQYHFGVRNLFIYLFIIVMQGDASLLLILNKLITDIQQRKF
jgi:hypothetical protein